MLLLDLKEELFCTRGCEGSEESKRLKNNKTGRRNWLTRIWKCFLITTVYFLVNVVTDIRQIPSTTTMSVCRAARLARVRPAAIKASSSRRLASTSSDHHDHHDHHGSSDGVEYPKEGACVKSRFNGLYKVDMLIIWTIGFSGPFWRNTVLFVAITTGVATLAPEGLLSPSGDEAPWLTRVLSHYAPKAGLWARTNEAHLEREEEKAQYNHVVQTAKRPQVHRFKYPL